MNKTEFNKDYLIRYYPDNDENNTQLIGLDTMKKIVNKQKIYDWIMKKIDNNTEDFVLIKLRRGISFKIIHR